jgi:PAS domain S-box-containing protein
VTAGSEPATPATANRRRSPRALGILVALITAVALGILGWTLVSLDGITEGFHDTQVLSDTVANVQRELLMVRVEVANLHHGGGTSLALRKGLLLRQVSNLPYLVSSGNEDVEHVVASIRGIDWEALDKLPSGPEADAVIDRVEQQLVTVEREFKAFYDGQVRSFYATSGKALQAKANSQRLLSTLLLFTAVLAAAWGLTARRRSRNDLTEAYEALRVSDERARAVIDTASDAFIALDEAGLVTDWNQRSEALFGWSGDEALGRPLTELIIPEDLRPAHLRGLKRFLQTEQGDLFGRRIELRAQARDERQFLVEMTLWATRVGSRWVFNAFLRDITERKKMSELQARMAAIVESSDEAIMALDTDLVVTSWNPGAERLYGYPAAEAIGRRIEFLQAPGTESMTADLIDPLFRGERVSGHEAQARRRDGSLVSVSISTSSIDDADGRIGGISVISHDVTDRHRLEAEVRHAQKLESVGQLAAGIAHEINTPIQFIGDNVRFLGDAFKQLAMELDGQTEQDKELAFLVEEVPEAVDQTLQGVDRVATIVRAMKAFGHPSGEEKAPADLNEAVRNSLIVANNEIKYVADVVTDLGDLPPVWCHLGDINQVVLNLVVNAAHAVGEQHVEGRLGTITVRTAVEADHVLIEVADTGIGIPPGIAERIFEPFFTTKDVGKGTGQGLTLAYALIRDRHNGTITFQSEPGAGTTFTVRLPILAPAARETAAPGR